MPIPSYTSVSIMSYSPIAGVRRASGTSMSVLADVDVRGPAYQANSDILSRLTKQADPKKRLSFALWAMDRAPSADLRDRLPLEMIILHYVRTLPAWPVLGHAPALNIIVVDWPIADSYEIRAYLVGSSDLIAPETLPFFYEQQREAILATGETTMPPVSKVD